MNSIHGPYESIHFKLWKFSLVGESFMIPGGEIFLIAHCFKTNLTTLVRNFQNPQRYDDFLKIDSKLDDYQLQIGVKFR